MRIALGLEYLGTNYHGWQKQDGLSTVQCTVEQALSRVADSAINITCAGRTDTGVHAKGQVVHFDTDAKRDMRAWIFGTNGYLPPDIRVQWANEVADDFHARFSAISRSYRYQIYNHNIPSALLYGRTTFFPLPLNAELMHEAAQCLLGEHDFSAYRGSGCQSHSPNRNVMNLNIWREDKIINIDITANAFLQHMVRNIVGVLLEIGTGKRPVSWAKEVLDGRDRNLGGITAPPFGLYLMKVKYIAIIEQIKQL